MKSELVAPRTSEFVEAERIARACYAKLENVRGQLLKQRQVAAEAARELDTRISIAAWESAKCPDEARRAREACAEAAELFEQEAKLLRALTLAAANARSEAKQASKRVYGEITHFVSSLLIDSDLGKLIALGKEIDSKQNLTQGH